jgi:hypothetical protein
LCECTSLAAFELDGKQQVCHMSARTLSFSEFLRISYREVAPTVIYSQFVKRSEVIWFSSVVLHENGDLSKFNPSNPLARELGQTRLCRKLGVPAPSERRRL